MAELNDRLNGSYPSIHLLLGIRKQEVRSAFDLDVERALPSIRQSNFSILERDRSCWSEVVFCLVVAKVGALNLEESPLQRLSNFSNLCQEPVHRSLELGQILLQRVYPLGHLG